MTWELQLPVLQLGNSSPRCHAGVDALGTEPLEEVGLGEQT